MAEPTGRRGLRTLRSSDSPFDGRFYLRDERFWPIAGAAAVFADDPGWPAPEAYGRAFRGAAAPVRFVRSEPRKRVRGEPIDVEAMYDGQIARGVVPTRERSWHDFLNALVWATFPQAKLALHTRQHALIKAWVLPGATALPNARTRPQDALAVIDEGGVVLLRSDEGERAVPFGHGIFEGLVLGSMAMVPRAVPVAAERLPGNPAEAVAMADQALATLVAGTLDPSMLPRYPLR